MKCVTSFEFVDIGDATMRFWQIEFAEALDLSAIGYETGTPEDPLLEWAECGTPLIGAADANDIFVGHLPGIRLSNVTAFREDRLALCYDIGAGVSRLSFASPADNVRRIPVSAPCRGEVWVESLGRVRASERRTRSALSFALLPDCSIEWPDRLYSENERPTITLRGDGAVTAEFHECDRIVGKSRSWTVPQTQSWVEGEVRCGAVGIRVAKRVFRAGIEDEGGAPLVIVKEKLNEDAAVRVRGLPGCLVSLRLQTPDESLEMPLLQRFDPHGIAIARRWDLRDGFAQLPTPAVVIIDVGTADWVPTTARIIDLQQIERWLFDPHREAAPLWIGQLSKDFGEMLRSLLRELQEQSDSYAPPPVSSLPPVIALWARGIFACTVILAKRAVLAAPATVTQLLADVPRELRRTLDWVIRARSTLDEGSDDFSGLCAEYADLQQLPQWEPWQQRLYELHTRLVAEAELVPLIDEWRGDVAAGLREPTSAIGTMNGGRHLTHAYVHDNAGRFLPAYTRLREISRDVPPVVSDLRSLLATLLFLKVGGGASDENREVSARCHRRLRPLVHALQGMLATQMGQPLPPAIGTADALSPEVLPLQPNDAEMIRDGLETLSRRFTESG